MSYINEAVIYNIYPLGFCGAPRENDGKLVYRLDKIYDCIEHMKKLSANVLVLNPVFESSRHGYDTIDYRKIDCRLGDNNSFKQICNTLHENGIRVILDGVFNHVGREFFAFKDIQQNLQNSRYCGWFQNLNFGGSSPMGDPFWYDGWAGHYDLVKLNLQNDEVVNYLLDSVKFWINEFGIDGLRLDAADCIDIEFFKKLRYVCKSKKPDFGQTVKHLTLPQTMSATREYTQATTTTTILRLPIRLTGSSETAEFIIIYTPITLLTTTM